MVGRGAKEDVQHPTYRRLPDAVKAMLEKPLKGIRARRPDAVGLLDHPLKVPEQARQFGGNVKLEAGSNAFLLKRAAMRGFTGR